MPLPTRTFILHLMYALLLLTGVGELRAQSGSSDFNVETGQLKLGDSPAGGSPAQPARQRRTLAETRQMLAEMSSGYRSACCPHQEMADPQCPCNRQQMYMLEYLIMQGFERHEIDAFMVSGGPKDLASDYQTWLVKEKAVSRDFVYDFMRKSGRGPDGLWRLKGETGGGAIDGPGWEKGWSTLIHETPEGAFLYAMLAVLGLMCIGVVAVGVKVLRKPALAESSADAAPAATPEGEAAKRIERELAQMDEDS